jgi:small-conductance mechanosensitive channel
MKEFIMQLVSGVPYLDNKYIIALIIVILFAILAKILLFVFNNYLQRMAKKTKTKVDDLIFDNVKSPLFYLILAYGLKLAISFLEINGIVTKMVNSLMALVFVYIILRAIDVIIETWGMTIAKKTKTRIDEVLLPLLHKASKVVFVIVALMWVLDIWEIDITPYLAGVGISGIVLGLALQDSLRNVFGGVTLLLDKTFQVGDKIMLQDGAVGEVLDIGLRSTKMRTYDNELVYIPNGYLANSKIQNYTRPNPQVRTSVLFGVEYGSDVQKVKKLVLAEINKMDGVMSDPEPSVQFLSMGDFALNFKASFWVEQWNNAYGRKLEATEKIYDALNKSKIGIPFPTQTVFLKK